jgi:aspartyl protease family protein
MFKDAFIISIAAICAIFAGVSAFYLDRALTQHAQNEPSKNQSMIVVEERPVKHITNTHMIAVPKAQDGHFWLEASVNSKAVRFLVDTGASSVALTPADAQRLGFSVPNLTYNRTVITASGKIKAASVMLDEIKIGNMPVKQVEALVISEGLETSLLGMSYLGRLNRIEVTRSSLVLHP